MNTPFLKRIKDSLNQPDMLMDLFPNMLVAMSWLLDGKCNVLGQTVLQRHHDLRHLALPVYTVSEGVALSKDLTAEPVLNCSGRRHVLVM